MEKKSKIYVSKSFLKPAQKLCSLQNYLATKNEKFFKLKIDIKSIQDLLINSYEYFFF